MASTTLIDPDAPVARANDSAVALVDCRFNLDGH
jgi:hypothetical protein